MISAVTNAEAMTSRLIARARALGEARAEIRALARRGDPVRSRRAGLLWPLFAKG